MFIANATSSPKPLPLLGRPLTPGHAARPGDPRWWPLTLGHGSLSACLEPSDARLSASNGLGVCQYRDEGDRPVNGHPGPPVAWNPVAASPRPGDPAHAPRESDPASSRAGDDKPCDTIAQPPRGKVTLSPTLGTPKDSSLTELPIGAGTTKAHAVCREPGNRSEPHRHGSLQDHQYARAHAHPHPCVAS